MSLTIPFGLGAGRSQTTAGGTSEGFFSRLPGEQSAELSAVPAAPEGRLCFTGRARLVSAEHLTSPAKEPSRSEISLLTGAEVSDCHLVFKIPGSQASFRACLQVQVQISADIRVTQQPKHPF